MFSFLHHRTKITTIDYIPGIGVVLLILIHDRYLICRRGIWYELIPSAYPEQFTRQTYEPRRQVPCIMSKLETEKQRIREKLERSVKAMEQAYREAQLLEEAEWDTDSDEEYTSEEEEDDDEEEEEPIYWEFVKHLAKDDTGEKIRQDIEQEENYMIARFDFH
ncbi:uncharacterized protein LOC123553352 [Mercenaria mercenaria]|uniref:uncharacterized protein LOC123553352 n=1 Tax=Mercenaria mercenaria TaxID=6596 RepID=UPI001E1D50DA|nr:uncharacterized protein LOC123553352 [Mercenaria mercenaria]